VEERERVDGYEAAFIGIIQGSRPICQMKGLSYLALACMGELGEHISLQETHLSSGFGPRP
jgi:hypothetical protein